MALIAYEGFDWTNNLSVLLTDGWTSTETPAFTTGRFGTGFASTRGSNNSQLYKNFPSTYSTLIFGYAVRWIGGSVDSLILLSADRATTILALHWNALSNKLELRSAASGGGSLLGTSNTVFIPNFWYYIEVKAHVAGASGTLELHVGSTVDLSSFTANIGSTNIGAFTTRQSVSSPAGGNDYDDMYFCDTTGSGPTNDFLGEIRVETLLPTGAGVYTQWTPNAGTNFSRVNETSPDGDTTYVSDANSGDRDSYILANLSSTTGTVYAIKPRIYSRKDDAGIKAVTTFYRQGGGASTNHDLTSYVQLANYAPYAADIIETNPDTSAAWTIADVNNTDLGILVT